MMTTPVHDVAPEVDAPTRDAGRRRVAWWLAVTPLVLAAVLSIGYSARSMVYRLTLAYPQNPWESAILADAFRASRGLEVYERMDARGDGHATHLYGPLTSQFLGLVFRATGGPRLEAGRAVNFAAALVLGILLVGGQLDRLRPVEVVVAVALFLSLHFRARAYFVETRPDLLGALFATLAVCCFYRAHIGGGTSVEGTRPPWAWYLPGIALAVIAFLFKQTYAACAAVPIVAVLITRPDGLVRHGAMAAVPLLVLGVFVAVVVRAVAPVVYFYTIEVPRMYVVNMPRLGLAGMSLLMYGPLVVAQLGWALLAPRSEGAAVLRSPRGAWLVAASLIGCGAGALAFAKRGGSYNSLLLGWIPLTALSIALLGPLCRALAAAPLVQVRWLSFAGWAVGAGTTIGALLLIGTLGVPASERVAWSYGHGGPEHRRVVETVRSLEGMVICPDDPTIPMLARGEVGRSLEAELDASGRKDFTPGLRREMQQSDWIVTVHADFDDRRFSPEVMAGLGFERVKRAPFDKTYRLWKRTGAKPTTTPAGTSGPTGDDPNGSAID